jgi:hypothetical protein
MACSPQSPTHSVAQGIIGNLTTHSPLFSGIGGAFSPPKKRQRKHCLLQVREKSIPEGLVLGPDKSFTAISVIAETPGASNHKSPADEGGSVCMTDMIDRVACYLFEGVQGVQGVQGDALDQETGRRAFVDAVTACYNAGFTVGSSGAGGGTSEEALSAACLPLYALLAHQNLSSDRSCGDTGSYHCQDPNNQCGELTVHGLTVKDLCYCALVMSIWRRMNETLVTGSLIGDDGYVQAPACDAAFCLFLFLSCCCLIPRSRSHPHYHSHSHSSPSPCARPSTPPHPSPLHPLQPHRDGPHRLAPVPQAP